MNWTDFVFDPPESAVQENFNALHAQPDRGVERAWSYLGSSGPDRKHEHSQATVKAAATLGKIVLSIGNVFRVPPPGASEASIAVFKGTGIDAEKWRGPPAWRIDHKDGQTYRFGSKVTDPSILLPAVDAMFLRKPTRIGRT